MIGWGAGCQVVPMQKISWVFGAPSLQWTFVTLPILSTVAPSMDDMSSHPTTAGWKEHVSGTSWLQFLYLSITCVMKQKNVKGSSWSWPPPVNFCLSGLLTMTWICASIPNSQTRSNSQTMIVQSRNIPGQSGQDKWNTGLWNQMSFEFLFSTETSERHNICLFITWEQTMSKHSAFPHWSNWCSCSLKWIPANSSWNPLLSSRFVGELWNQTSTVLLSTSITFGSSILPHSVTWLVLLYGLKMESRDFSHAQVPPA